MKDFQTSGKIQSDRKVYVQRAQDREYLDYTRSGQSFYILGCRTMGKSSLVRHWSDELSTGGIRTCEILLHDIGFKPGPATFARWLAIFAQELYLALIGPQQITRLEFNGASDFRLWLRSLNDELPHRRLLLAIDEIDCVGGLAYADEIFSLFRSIPDTCSNIQVVEIGLESPGASGNNLLGARTAIGPTIRMLDFPHNGETFAGLSTGTPEGLLTAEFFDCVMSLTGGQPQLTMRLMSEVRRLQLTDRKELETFAEQLIQDELLTPNDAFAQIPTFFKGIEGLRALRAFKSYLTFGSLSITESEEASLLKKSGLMRAAAGRLETKGELFRRYFSEDWADHQIRSLSRSMGQDRGSSPSRGRHICIINMGGTLGMKQIGEEAVPFEDDSDFLQAFPELRELGRVSYVDDVITPKDSINVFPEDWRLLAERIYDLHSEHRDPPIEGFVVVHGTDTMAYTASAIAMAFGKSLPFPIVFTGSQTLPHVHIGDAKTNLYRALKVAQEDIPEVVICFNDLVLRAVRAQKRDDRRYDGFESPTYPALAVITADVGIRKELLRDVELGGLKRPTATFSGGILEIGQLPGLEPEFFERILHLTIERQSKGLPTLTCQGIILRSYGAGNVANQFPYSLIELIGEAVGRGIPVIVTSQYSPDPGAHKQYGPAKAPVGVGAIPAGNMTVSAAATKFRWVLAEVDGLVATGILAAASRIREVEERMIYRDYVGELTEVRRKRGETA